MKYEREENKELIKKKILKQIRVKTMIKDKKKREGEQTNVTTQQRAWNHKQKKMSKGKRKEPKENK